ncbi:SRPBCC family protein [Granulicella arctica]|uniref:SRPBCC family protein n=1 Tax=Granulicella arctica TaxID=940613 RepID=UPI0021DFDD48|nr:SRPBCC family protein [Granulicella arctica]
MRYHFQSEQWLPYPVEHVFRFFSDPANLPRLMPDWQKARIDKATLTPAPAHPSNIPGTPVAGKGSRILLSFHPVPFAPIRLKWDAEIDEFAWNDHFCDLQLTGPFAYWHHCHHVSAETRDNIVGTLLRDDLHYEVPLGPLGVFANWLAVSGQIRSAFAFRHRRTAELLQEISA